MSEIRVTADVFGTPIDITYIRPMGAGFVPKDPTRPSYRIGVRRISDGVSGSFISQHRDLIPLWDEMIRAGKFPIQNVKIVAADDDSAYGLEYSDGSQAVVSAKCPECGARWDVYQTTPHVSGLPRRVRVCKACGTRGNTLEVRI